MFLSSVLGPLPFHCVSHKIASELDVLCKNALGWVIASTWLFEADAFISHGSVPVVTS